MEFTVVGLVNDRRSASFGLVYVRHSGYLGTVCDDGWHLQDAEVVCRELGFDGALEAIGGAGFGKGNGDIWLNNVGCVGNESSISECSHDGWGVVGKCYHDDDAGVYCKPRGKVSISGK